MTRTIPVDIDGLNLLLGGGIPILKRHKDLEESATLLVRGPPGSGKTIFGVQLASSIARSLGCDVAYGCVELLPSELAAQHSGIKRSELNERVITAPFTKQTIRGHKECRIFAEMLDIGSANEEVSRLGEAIEHLLRVVEQAGGYPRVLVIDSLSDGYNLGATKAPRELADALCKMAAQRGIVLILLEEIVESRPSAWSFATDIVLQLSPSEDVAVPGPSDSFERRLTIAKNRLGPSEAGVHRYVILPNWGISVLPAPRTYGSKWALRLILAGWENRHHSEQNWSIGLSSSWPHFQDCITAVYGPDTVNIFRLVDRLGKTTADGTLLAISTIFLDFSHPANIAKTTDSRTNKIHRIGCGDPYLSGDQLLSDVLATIDSLKTDRKSIGRIIIGDLQSLRSFWNPEGVRHALGVLMAILRRVRIPTVLFETTTPGPSHEPRIVDFADVTIEILQFPQVPISLVASCARQGLRESLNV